MALLGDLLEHVRGGEQVPSVDGAVQVAAALLGDLQRLGENRHRFAADVLGHVVQERGLFLLRFECGGRGDDMYVGKPPVRPHRIEVDFEDPLDFIAEEIDPDRGAGVGEEIDDAPADGEFPRRLDRFDPRIASAVEPSRKLTQIQPVADLHHAHQPVQLWCWGNRLHQGVYGTDNHRRAISLDELPEEAQSLGEQLRADRRFAWQQLQRWKLRSGDVQGVKLVDRLVGLVEMSGDQHKRSRHVPGQRRRHHDCARAACATDARKAASLDELP